MSNMQDLCLSSIFQNFQLLLVLNSSRRFYDADVVCVMDTEQFLLCGRTTGDPDTALQQSQFQHSIPDTGVPLRTLLMIRAPRGCGDQSSGRRN